MVSRAQTIPNSKIEALRPLGTLVRIARRVGQTLSFRRASKHRYDGAYKVTVLDLVRTLGSD